MPSFEMHEQHDESGTIWLLLCGELDLAFAEPLQIRLQQLAHAHTPVVLDLSLLQFIDSTGLQILTTYFSHASRNGWDLRIDPNLTSQVRQVIELVGLDQMLWP